MKKGFTLIELLAVIVILAIIALIATPIILGIINDAREKANERSVELYASAVRNGIAAYQLREGKEVLPGTYNETKPLPFEPEYDGQVDCTSVIISEEGKVSLDKCTVNGGTKEYSYGIEEEPSVAKVCELSDEDSNGKYSVGDIVTCTFSESTEQFYVIEDEDEDTTEGMSMLAMYNLYVGNSVDVDWGFTPLENPTGIQNPLAKGYVDGDTTFYGTVAFSTSKYWSSIDSYPAWVYNESSNLYQYVSAYETYLKENGVGSASSKLISYEQLDYLQCSGDDSSCSDAPEWVYSTTYWTGSAFGNNYVWIVDSDGNFDCADSGYVNGCGVRPVITISTSEI